MTIDLDQLEALARAATPGPWRIKTGYCLYDERDMHVVSAWETYSGSLNLAIYPDEAMANAKFLEAVNPATVLELIAELRAVKNKWAWSLLEDSVELNHMMEQLVRYIRLGSRQMVDGCPNHETWAVCKEKWREPREEGICIACWQRTVAKMQLPEVREYLTADFDKHGIEIEAE